MTGEQQEQLERFFDGALPAEEAAEIAARVDRDAEWGGAHAALSFTRGLLREQVEAQVSAADFSGLWDRVAAELPSPEPARRAVAQEPTAWEHLSAWWGRHWTPVLLSAAAAAAVSLIVVRMSVPSTDGDEAGVVAGGQGVIEVDAVENGGNTTVLISAPAGEGGPTVIWLLEDERGDAGAALDGEDPI